MKKKNTVSKTPDNSTKLPELRVHQNWREAAEYRFVFYSITEEPFREHMIYEMYKYFDEHTKSLMFEDFLIHFKIPFQTWWLWIKTYSDMAEATDQVMHLLGVRREVEALRFTAKDSMVLRNIHLYNKQWDKVNRYHAELKKDSEQPDNTFNVYLDKIEKVNLDQELKKIQERKNESITVAKEPALE